jgi:nitrogen regulatory protein PII
VTVTEVHGYGHLPGRVETYRGADYQIDFFPKTKVEIAVDDSIAEQVIEALCNVARTGGPSDGKVWVLELGQAVRVRTGEIGPDAI